MIEYKYLLSKAQELEQDSYRRDKKFAREDILSLIENLNELVEKTPHDSKAYLLQVVFTFNQFEDPDEVKMICENWFEKCNDPLAIIFISFINEEYEGGISVSLFEKLKELVTSSNRNRSIIDMYMGSYYIKRDFGNAVFYLTRASETFENNVHAHYMLGDVYKKNGDVINARKAYLQGINKIIKTYSLDNEENALDLFTPDKYINEMILWSENTVYKLEYLQRKLKV